MITIRIGRRLFGALPLIALTELARAPSRSGALLEAAIAGSNEATKAPNEIRRLRAEGYVNAVAWNAGGSRLAVLSAFGAIVTVWETTGLTVSRSFQRYGGAYSRNSVAFLPDGTLLTAAPIGLSPDPKYKTLEIFSLIQWDPETGTSVNYIPPPDSPLKIPRDEICPAETFAGSKDGTFVAGISKDNLLLFDAADWSMRNKLPTPPTPMHPDWPASVAISPDSRRVAVGTGFGYVHLFEVDSGVVLYSFSAYPEGLHDICAAVAFSPDGRMLVTGKGGNSVDDVDDGWVRLWRASDGAMIAHLVGGAGSVRTAHWDDEGDTLAVGDEQTL